MSFYRELYRFLEFSFLIYFDIIFEDWFKNHSSYEHFHALNFRVWNSLKNLVSSSFIQEISELSNSFVHSFFSLIFHHPGLYSTLKHTFSFEGRFPFACPFFWFPPLILSLVIQKMCHIRESSVCDSVTHMRGEN